MSRLLFAALLLLPTQVLAEPVTDAGRVVAVTVFQGQALVTREVSLAEAAGLVEVVVTGLPEQLMPGSLYAEPGEGVEIRSVRDRVRPSATAPQEEVRALQEELTNINEKLAALLSERDLIQHGEIYITQLEQFTAQTSRNELHKGVLNSEALRDLTDLVFTERRKLSEKQLKVSEQQKRLSKQRDLKNRELATLNAGGQKSTREAVVFVNKRAGAANVRLKYLVGGATWSPSYNLRATEEGDDITVEYNASVTQMSGEDWNDVTMTLSTATPSLVATAPTLDPLMIRLAARAPAVKSGRSKIDLSRMQKAIASNRGNSVSDEAQLRRNFSELSASDGRERESSAFGGGRGGGGFGAYYANEGLADTDRALNRFACELQLIDLVAGGSKSKKPTPSEPTSSTEGMSVVYRLPNTTSLPSRSDKQLIRIAALPVAAEFYRVATPVLTAYIYQEARLSNTTEYVLLAGPAATFLGDRFVGRGELPTVAIGEAFTVGLGIDESLRVTRELADKSDRIQGGNRIASFDYELSVENFGNEAVEVRLRDRLPKSDSDAIKVTLVTSDPETTKADSDGTLRWDLTVPAAGKAKVAYSMAIEHDKNLTIVGGQK